MRILYLCLFAFLLLTLNRNAVYSHLYRMSGTELKSQAMIIAKIALALWVAINVAAWLYIVAGSL